MPFMNNCIHLDKKRIRTSMFQKKHPSCKIYALGGDLCICYESNKYKMGCANIKECPKYEVKLFSDNMFKL